MSDLSASVAVCSEEELAEYFNVPKGWIHSALASGCETFDQVREYVSEIEFEIAYIRDGGSR